MKTLTPYILIAVMTIFLAGMVTYLTYNRGVIAAEKAQRDKEITEFQAQVIKSDNMAKSLEAQLEAMRLEKEQLNESLNDEIGKHVIYSTCVVPASGVQLINQARAGIEQGASTR